MEMAKSAKSAGDGRIAFLRTRYFASLDGLRCLSIAAVIWHHASRDTRGVAGKGYLGVNLFFAISGFLITTLLLRERSASGTVDLPAFYLRRTLRIFPLYYLVLASYVLLAFHLETDSFHTAQFRENLPYFATYTSNWFVDRSAGSRVIFYFAWSLATEEQFYFVWPSIVRFSRSCIQPAILALALLGVSQAAAAAVASGALDPSLPVRMLTSVAPAICFGCLAAIVLDHPAGHRYAGEILGRKWSAPLVLVLLAAAICSERPPPLLIDGLLAALVAACSLVPHGPLAAALETRALRHVGIVSYGMYLTHMFVINAVRWWMPGQSGLRTFAVSLPLTVLVATVTHRLVERPFLGLRERFRAMPLEIALGPR